MSIGTGKIISLLVKTVCKPDRQSTNHFDADLTVRGAALPLSNWKQFDCLVETENKEQFAFGCFGFNPPSIEAVQKLYSERPQAFIKSAYSL